MRRERVDVTEFTRPGIYQVECIETKKFFFGESEATFFTLRDIYLNMNEGICENQELLEDLKKYGIEGFRFWVVFTSVILYNPEYRKRMLEEIKESWDGDLYF